MKHCRSKSPCTICNRSNHNSLLCKNQLVTATTSHSKSQHSTYLYEVCLASNSGRPVTITCFVLIQITGKVSSLDLQVIKELFPKLDPNLFQCHSEEVDILIGADLCSLHPKQVVATAGSNLKVLEGSFGMCLHGTHSRLRLCGEQKSHFTQISVCSQAVEKKQ
ncbi:hypothetical protein EB796_013255 [Bugula neritina]|uniref:Uncharacterized protein n=1 Tax=Bugula neritina TaxID=10212 RepID=A0A7J7JR17_BUGNE|nr:hypothetical protein EB796_013255 [Bugula neritina]